MSDPLSEYQKRIDVKKEMEGHDEFLKVDESGEHMMGIGPYGIKFRGITHVRDFLDVEGTLYVNGKNVFQELDRLNHEIQELKSELLYLRTKDNSIY